VGNAVTPGPLGTSNVYKDYIDTGTMCRTRSPYPGPINTLSAQYDASEQVVFGNAYLFRLADEILPSGKLVRKVRSSTKSDHSKYDRSKSGNFWITPHPISPSESTL